MSLPSQLLLPKDGRTRCQFLLTLPIAVAVGGMYGFDLAGAKQLPVTLAILAGAGGLTAFVYVQLLLEPVVVARLTDGSGRFDEAVLFAWDAVLGTVVGLPLFTALGVAPLPAMAAAAGAGFMYGYVAGWVACGGAAELALGSITGARGGKPRKSDHSYIQSLEARGDHQAAREAYREVLAGDPGDLEIALRLGRLLAGPMGRPAEAIPVVRRAIEAREPDRPEWSRALMVLADIAEARLGRPRLVERDLRRLAEKHPDTPEGAWARSRLEMIGEGTA